MQKRRKEDKLPYQEWTLTKHLHKAWEIHVQCDYHRRLKTHFSHLPKGCTSATSICALAELYNMLRQKQKKDSWDHSKSKHKHHKLSIKKIKKSSASQNVLSTKFLLLPTGVLGKRNLLSLKASHLQPVTWKNTLFFKTEWRTEGCSFKEEKESRQFLDKSENKLTSIPIRDIFQP